MTVVHIEKISTGLWTISANFKTELKGDLHYSSTRSRTACLKHPILLYLQFYRTKNSTHVLMIYATVMSMKM